MDTLLLDKTGTITLGNRQATEFRPVRGVSEEELADAAQLASLADETPEGRSIVVLAKEKYRIRARDMGGLAATFVPFTAQSRMSGVDLQGSSIRKGAVEAVLASLSAQPIPSRGSNAAFAVSEAEPEAAREIRAIAEEIAKAGGTPLAVARDGRLLGVVYLKDIVKGGIRERFAELRRMGIRTVMITGDNPMTAAAIAAEAGVDDFLAQATPEDKLALIRREQAEGKLVAMCGDGTNDAPALAQADVGVAMNTGTVAAREAGNMVDLDSDPTKLIEIVGIGKQLLMTRGALTTFSIANDVAKYFAIIPAMFLTLYPQLQALNVMKLASPQSAILSAIIFNALIIIALIPLALRGVTYRPVGAASLLRRNLLIYGLGGVIVPFVAIKAIDLAVSALHPRLTRFPSPARGGEGPFRKLAAMLHHLRPALVVGLGLTVITGLAYPLAMTGLAGAIFPAKAAGSLIERDGHVVGSSLIGQNFTGAGYFHGRPSATTAPDPADASKTVPAPYNASNSAGSNLGPTSAALADRVKGDLATLHAENPKEPVPVDLVTTSGSGLDPDISPEAALFQVPRIAAARHLSEARLQALVTSRIEDRTLGLLGERRVNVLALNLALDDLAGH